MKFQHFIISLAGLAILPASLAAAVFDANEAPIGISDNNLGPAALTCRFNPIASH